MSDTVVFIPAWNAEDTLPAVLAELQGELPDPDVLVIDDGSTDGTAEVARAHGAQVVSFGENRGLRMGIAAGYREAMERGYAVCGRVDADGQHPVVEMARLIALVRDDACDVAVGSRSASIRRRIPLHLMNEQRMSTRSAAANSFESCDASEGSRRVPVRRADRASGVAGRDAVARPACGR